MTSFSEMKTTQNRNITHKDSLKVYLQLPTTLLFVLYSQVFVFNDTSVFLCCSLNISRTSQAIKFIL